MLAGTLFVEGRSAPFARLFGLSGETETLCLQAMRIISLSFLFAGTNITFQGIFQALDGGLESLLISICRQMLFVLPVAWLFAQVARSDPERAWLVWWTFPIAEFVSMGIGCLLMQRVQRKQQLHL